MYSFIDSNYFLFILCLCSWLYNNMVEWSMSWSKTYYTGLTNTQHKINDDWFKNVLRVLKR